MANLSSKTTLPSWTDTATFYLPFTDQSLVIIDQLKAVTLGFGIESRELGDNSVLSHKYAFGRYVCKDGKPHIGIARDSFVIKLDRDSFKKKGL
jgi:hypothetical protein